VRCEVVAIGTELLLGQVVDTNSSWMGERLALAGIDSVNAPQDVRLAAWSRLATDLDLDKLARATRVVRLADVPGLAEPVLRGQVRGRTVVDVSA